MRTDSGTAVQPERPEQKEGMKQTSTSTGDAHYQEYDKRQRARSVYRTAARQADGKFHTFLAMKISLKLIFPLWFCLILALKHTSLNSCNVTAEELCYFKFTENMTEEGILNRITLIYVTEQL